MITLFCVFIYFTSYCFAQNFSSFPPPASTENFERPCPVYDTNCIRQFFAKNGQCKIAYGPVPEPYYRAQATYYLSSVNITTTFLDIELKGLNGRIEEFYINRETDKLVLAIDFRGLSISSNNTYFRFHRRAREPIITSDFAFGIYQSVVITIIIPNLNNLQLEESESFVYPSEEIPVYGLGPGLANSIDPVVPAALAEFKTSIKTIVREAFLTDGAFYPATFIQWNICDFGLRIL